MPKQAQTNDLAEYDGSTPLKAVMQERFVENLLKGMTQTDAVKLAGYKAKQPANQSNQLQRNTKVAARLAYRRAELQAQMQSATAITEEKVVRELANCAFANMADFLTSDEEGNIHFVDLNSLSREQMAAVESVKITKQTTTNKSGDREYTTQHTQFKLHSKTNTLEQLGKHLGLFAADNNQRAEKTLIMFVNSRNQPILSNVPSDTKEIVDAVDRES